jgi:hypothetical protein
LLTRLAVLIALAVIVAATASVMRPDAALLKWLGPGVGVAGSVVGFIWIRRITGSSPDNDPSPWRSRRY